VVNTMPVGHRPNIVLAADGNVFVGSFVKDRMSIVSAATGKLRSYAPRIGVGASDAVVSDGSVWVSSSRTNQIMRLDARTGRPIGDPIRLPFPVTTVVVRPDAIWAGLQPGNLQPDQLVRIDRKTGEIGTPVSYPDGIRSMTTSPTALWISARRRALIQRVDPKTGAALKTLRIASGRSDDLVYSRGSLWAAVSTEDTVYKVSTSTLDPIPIGVGSRPLRLAVTDDTAYVTNMGSSNLTMIDSKSAQVIGDPLHLHVTPYALSADDTGKTLWVSSVNDSHLAEIATGRGG
jgi:streptogramin lyase